MRKPKKSLAVFISKQRVFILIPNFRNLAISREDTRNQFMDEDSQLKRILHLALTNAVSRMEELKEPKDRRCLFHEYKEWMGEELNDEVWAIPIDFGHESLDVN